MKNEINFRRVVDFMLSIESAKSRGLLVRWVTWVRGSNFYVGCVGYVGENISCVDHNFYVVCLGQKSVRGSKFLREWFFGCGRKGG